MKTLAAHPLFWPGVTLLLLVALNAVVNPGFLALTLRDGHLYGNLVDILNRAAPLALVAAGMTLVIAARGLDISVGAVVAITAAVAALLIGGSLNLDGATTSRFPMWFALVAALGVATLCGIWNGALVVGVGMQPIIATLILMVAGRGIAQLLTGGQIIPIGAPGYLEIGGGYLAAVPCSVWIAIATIAATALLVNRTALGLFIRAIGVNPVATRLVGLRAGAVVFGVYLCSGVMSALAGILASSNVRSADGNNAGL